MAAGGRQLERSNSDVAIAGLCASADPSSGSLIKANGSEGAWAVVEVDQNDRPQRVDLTR
jgi:hypothetical protein